MPLPDEHAGEPTIEVPASLVKRWREARENREGWEKVEKRLKEELAEALGDAFAGTVDGETVLTYRPSKAYAEARIMREFPDLVQHFMTIKRVEVLDLEAFVSRHPEIAEKFRVRSFREVTG